MVPGTSRASISASRARASARVPAAAFLTPRGLGLRGLGLHVHEMLSATPNTSEHTVPGIFVGSWWWTTNLVHDYS